MSRRRSQAARRPQARRAPAPTSAPPVSAPPAPAAPCPCGLDAAYGECCGRFHSGRAAAPTAEALMRSRYAAFATGDEAYLLRTWHPTTRPERVDLTDGPRWTGLEIVGTTAGSAFHSEGTVTFRAHWAADGQSGTLDEHSRFVRHEGAWVYLDAVA